MFVTLAITFWLSLCPRWRRLESLRHMAVSPAAIRARQPRSHLLQSHFRLHSLLIRDVDCCWRHQLYHHQCKLRERWFNYKDVSLFFLNTIFSLVSKTAKLEPPPLVSAAANDDKVNSLCWYSRLPCRDGQNAKATHEHRQNPPFSAVSFRMQKAEIQWPGGSPVLSL